MTELHSTFPRQKFCLFSTKILPNKWMIQVEETSLQKDVLGINAQSMSLVRFKYR